ncbi:MULTISPECIES: bifunctional DNA-formamidopyrimidine glycosylase/DNA-(apurinic or apyrimidinic site) lyase [Pseudomonas aeruginosa group]|uniref:bifunctional DNA-formamidopyrimidine glycosylase/DNA-(apurinic or apyrimidinic site) lyase n=1 Tax=Pseudomonas aeruginosa group TaxID=136841 RepID=UPI00071B45A5|nr:MULTISPECIES: bifunctional DNA-formamidopyrimidine glycosylase/DNA-(apurinic or apyrimidinic site) lyase [Pseudomonas aeruginosa group]KSC48889.1 formamidopyrimidine-DNA glycosylase [Pseudomonas paraeruginosa]KSL13257.1 formamidopyrimidine-DNA glycosylase [Pseudomonas aeruginosa]MBH8716974.1 bifunctional DNA-formamidopyrimidine glycosylase/DNA-(apurinic or apyrimidinic site) lyase [Pseudomonas aeruginosa]MBH9343671.1 bifunctional DNA-formamidopyrimidine glycosylase/DNA-(apurinic or apyrimidi
MPELPEVETTRRGIAPYLEGQRVERVIVRERRLRWPIPEDLDVRLSGQRIVSVERRAKYLLLGAEAGTLISHLGMSGSLRLVESGTPASRHEHVDIELASGMSLRYTDPRRFGAMLWSLAPLEHELLRNLGPEPLTDAFAGQRLFELSRGRSMAVKPFIMDNAVVVGVGNIYASEALFAAGIDPRKPAGSISKARYMRLAEEIKRILAIAIERGGTTLRDFVGGDGQPGYFQQELFVYGRGGEFCKVCGSTLREIRLGQRASVYCPRCQR